ncbi:MAG TPA: hypothetical protein VFI27_10275, partial [candidate division Zixibacteria bacterium]|nr:hypothetical protein [candidate division Zixibacteria bacterium]
VRMLPLLLFSFGYVLFRAAQLVARKQGNISFGEMMALMYLLGVVGMLMLSNQQPTRHLILLIPPMSLVSAMAIDRILRVERIGTAKNLGYLFPIVVFVGLAYLFYQVFAALFRLVVAMRLGTSVGDYSTITPMPILQATMFVALVPAILATFFILVLLSSSGDWLNKLYSRRRLGYIVVVLIAILIAGDLFQYLSWAQEPEYSIVEASRQFKEDFGDEAVLGGAYAAILGLENDNPGQLFFEIPLRSPEFQQKVLDSGLTHLAMESSSIFGDIPINDVEMRKNASEFVKNLHLIQTYYVRGYFVRVYEIERD